MADPEVSDSRLFALANELICDAEAALPGVQCTVLLHQGRSTGRMVIVGSNMKDAEMHALLATAVVSSTEGEMQEQPGLSVADIAARDAQAVHDAQAEGQPAPVTPITAARRGRATRCKDRR